jgi:type I restriction enzyme S subunit
MEFDSFTTLQRGKDLTKAQFREGIVPVAGSNGVIGYHDTAIAKAPGITVGRSGSAGKVTVYKEDFWPHNTSLYVRDFHGNDPYFAGFLLGALNLARFKTGASVPTLDRNSFKMLPLLIPPLPEQKKIAYILSTVQRAIEAQERIIQTTTELKKALMHKLFSEGLRNEPQKQSEIGPIPESWEVVTFGDSVSIKNGQVDPRQHPFDEMLHVGPENIESDTGRIVKLSTNGELNISSGNYYFTSEDVLYSKIRPYLNKVALPDFEGTCSADMYPLRSESHFIREFLFYYLLSDEFKKAAMSFQDRTGIPKINRAQLGCIHLACPTKEEQSEIAEALFSCDNRRDLAQRKKSQLQDLFRTLLNELMTAKTRVHEVDLSS